MERRAVSPEFAPFEHRRVIESRHAEALLGPLFSTHGLDLPPLPPGPLDFRWTVRSPGVGPTPWMSLPSRTQPEHFEQMKRAAWAAQQVLRVWMPYLYFQKLDNYRDRHCSWPMLVFGAMRPIESRSRAAYGYDVLEPKTIHSSFRWAGRPLRLELHRIHAVLPELGRPDLLESFPSKNPDRMLRLMQAIPRYFGRLVRMEASILREFARFADLPEEQRAKGYAVMRSEVKRVMARTFRAFSFAPLGPLAMMAATWALGRAQGRRIGFEAEVEFRTQDGRHGFSLTAPISYANSRLQRPLR